MQKIVRKGLVMLAIVATAWFSYSCATLSNVAGSVLNGGGALSTEEIASGLKEALMVGSNNSASKGGALDGFLKNEAIKLLFPPEAVKVEQRLRQLGMGQLCDNFVTALNRGAEDAVKQAGPIFVNAIKQMTIQDALGILKGDKDAATQYLKRSSTTALAAAFKPVIINSLEKTNATKYYTELANTYNKIPLVQRVNPDLSDFATQKAIDGIFTLVADEEAKIREDPAARVSDLLKRVFGAKV
jgi:hypothetical protein